jgi:O-antigen/teichoic acid export membrane protein
VVGKVGTFAWTAVAARRLGPAGFGVFTVALSVALILSNLSEWSFDAALIQRASSDPDRRNAYLTDAVVCEGLLAVALFGAGGLLVAHWLPGSATVALALVLLSVYLDSFSDTLRAASAAVQRQGGTSLALIAQRALAAGVGIGLLLAGYGLTGLATALAATSALGLVGHIAAVWQLDLRLTRSAVSLQLFNRFIAGTWPIGVANVVLATLFRIDAVMLGGLRGTTAVGAYGAAYKLFDTTLFYAFALNGVLLPVMSASMPGNGSSPRRLSTALQAGVTALAFGYFPVAAVCLAAPGPVLRLVFGARYAAESAHALAWLALAPFAFGLAFLCASVLQAARRTGGLLIAALAATVVNVVANAIAIPAYGGTAAACTTTLSYAVESVILLGLLYRRFGLRLNAAAAVATPLTAALVLAVVLRLAPSAVVVTLPLGGLAYLVICALGLGRFQRTAFGDLRAAFSRIPNL